MSRWFRSAKSQAHSLVAETEEKNLQDVEGALLLLLDDDIEGADKILYGKESTYHHVGRGLSKFIASMLSAEKDILSEAAAILLVSENKAWEDMKKAQRESSAFKSSIYPPGTEYLLCYSVAQLCSAMTVVLSANITEAIRAFYKLRKAFITVEGIMMAEPKSLKGQMEYLTSQSPDRSSQSSLDSQDEDSATLKEEEAKGGSSPKTHKLRPSARRIQPDSVDFDPATASSIVTNQTDVFIYSGTRLCYGLLLLIFSMIQNPIFTKILAVVGFKGNRELGSKLLWQTTTFSSFNSAIAGILLLGYYNVMTFSDILPTDPNADEDLSGYPKARCQTLLSKMRERYPHSKLWKLEEARMHANNRDLAAACEILAENSENAALKQLESITAFELAFHTAFAHDYPLCAETWIRVNELGAWSPTLYAYMTGCAYLELYRDIRHSDPETAKAHKAKAVEFFKKAPPVAGKNRVMTKQIPFDIFCVKKIHKWESRAKAWDVDFVDAIGVSPISEMVYFWNGIKKMGPKELQKSLDVLSWERANLPEKLRTDLDEMAIRAVIQASVLRNLGRFSEARKILQEDILDHDRHEFETYQSKDNWTCKNAPYEMACLAWSEKDLEGEDEEEKVVECEEWLDRLRNGPESYVLDTRLSFKITISLMTIRRHREVVEC